jgi:transposase
MSTTMTSDEQRMAKQQVLAAFEHGCTVQNLLRTTSIPLHRATVYRLHQRFQTDPETALSDGRHGHPNKLRDGVRAWLEEYCQAVPSCTSRSVQTALEERFAIRVSIAHLNRVRAALVVHPACSGHFWNSVKHLWKPYKCLRRLFHSVKKASWTWRMHH